MGSGNYIMRLWLCADPVDLYCCSIMLLEVRKNGRRHCLTLIVRCVVGLQG
jgi:hypothetical protein